MIVLANACQATHEIGTSTDTKTDRRVIARNSSRRTLRLVTCIEAGDMTARITKKTPAKYDRFNDAKTPLHARASGRKYAIHKYSPAAYKGLLKASAHPTTRMTVTKMLRNMVQPAVFSWRAQRSSIQTAHSANEWSWPARCSTNSCWT